MKKFLFFALFFSGVLFSNVLLADDLVPVHTPCGRTVYLKPSDYKDGKEMADAALDIALAACKNVKGEDDGKKKEDEKKDHIAD